MANNERSWTLELYEWMLRMNIPHPCIVFTDEQGNYWVKPITVKCVVQEAANA